MYQLKEIENNRPYQGVLFTNKAKARIYRRGFNRAAGFPKYYVAPTTR